MKRRYEMWTLAASLCWGSTVAAQQPLAPVEARVPFAPSAFIGTDGSSHLAYELDITNIYGDTGPLKPKGLDVYGDDATLPLAHFSASELADMTRPTPSEHTPVTIESGKRVVIYVWITLSAGSVAPRTLRHRMVFAAAKGKTELLDGVLVPVKSAAPLIIGPPLRGGRWLAHEGPGNAHSHHWGSLVAVNGMVTIPQRYAFDLVGVDQQGHAMRAGVQDISHSCYADWIGYGADVIAVADGVIADAHDGEPEHAPLSPQGEPDSLTTRGVFGNYVVLQLAAGEFASYAHLQRGSVTVHAGDQVTRGQLLGHLGQSGGSSAPHLHFQLSNAATFEGSEGLPFVFDRFDFFGPESEAQLFAQGEPWTPIPAQTRQAQLPLNDVVIGFR